MMSSFAMNDLNTVSNEIIRKKLFFFLEIVLTEIHSISDIELSVTPLQG